MVNFSTPQSNSNNTGNKNNVFGDPVDQFRNPKEENPELQARRNVKDLEVEEVTEMGLKALDLLDKMKRMADIECTTLGKDTDGNWVSSDESLRPDDIEWVVLDVDFDALRQQSLDAGEKPDLEFTGYRSQQGALARAVVSHIQGSGIPEYKDWEDNGIRVFYDGNHKVVVLPKDDELIKTLVTEMNLQRFYDVSSFGIDAE